MEPHMSSPSPCNKNHEGTSFTSIEMFHTHTPSSSVFFRLRLFKAPTSEMKVKIKGNGNEMAMGMR